MLYMGAVGMAEDGDQLHARLGTSAAHADRCQLALDPATSLRFVEFAWAYLRTQDTNAGRWRGGDRSVNSVIWVGMADVGIVCHVLAR